MSHHDDASPRLQACSGSAGGEGQHRGAAWTRWLGSKLARRAPGGRAERRAAGSTRSVALLDRSWLPQWERLQTSAAVALERTASGQAPDLQSPLPRRATGGGPLARRERVPLPALPACSSSACPPEHQCCLVNNMPESLSERDTCAKLNSVVQGRRAGIRRRSRMLSARPGWMRGTSASDDQRTLRCGSLGPTAAGSALACCQPPSMPALACACCLALARPQRHGLNQGTDMMDVNGPYHSTAAHRGC